MFRKVIEISEEFEGLSSVKGLREMEALSAIHLVPAVLVHVDLERNIVVSQLLYYA